MRWVCLALAVAIAAPAEARMPVRLPPLTIYPLTWDMNVEAAQKALETAQMAPTYDETRRYMVMTAEHPEVRHTSEPGWSFTPRKGWRGFTHFAWSASAKDYRIDRVVETREDLAPGALNDELAAVDATYGTPASTANNQKIWARAGTRLTASWSVDDTTKRATLYLAVRLDVAAL